ncbi:Peptidyl-prolyl cis-trans isomerase [Desulfamplus magnetovallimortis]|uniref:Peptidyl-prolyl cis-trans isomerase n=1 Tax=Desulfamplus magnetovallimortis TaxID=1246637 RepID=A0A1W1HJG4_9BACT|nr:peptidylprolyl isomerase [Desulfamplus magnetovallimortis]SLM32604.1 Peptidyl-prolyl cis-trans isomerase [Desulfamplus magnetovallimortis]
MTDVINAGDTISVDYTGKLENGKVFDSSEGKAPLTFTVGSGMLIRGFDSAVIGMKKGESKTVNIPPEEGYGVRNEDAFVELARQHIPEDIPLALGMMLQLQDPEGRPVPATVAEIGEESVKMDLNHFLAGETLTFDITIRETGLEPPQAHGCGCGSHSHDCGPDKHDCGSDSKGSCGCGC